MWLVYNGEIIIESKLPFNTNNRAFQYADGFFETIAFRNGEIRFLKDHMLRIKRGARVFNYQLPNTLLFKEDLTATISDLLDKNELKEDATIKIIVWRKEGGKYEPNTQEVDFIIKVVPKTWAEKPTILDKVALYSEFENAYTPISPIKSIASANYVLAGIYKQQQQLDDLIILGEDKAISECLYSNIFWIEKEVLYTPSYLTGCVEGVMRKQLFKACIQHGIPFQEGVFGLQDLLEAEFVFNANIAGFGVISSLEGKNFESTHPLFDTLVQGL